MAELTLEERKDLMITYMKLKMEEFDWHGVADAAMDLRELEVEIRLKGEKNDIIPIATCFNSCLR